MKVYTPGVIILLLSFLTYLYFLIKDKKNTEKATIIGLKLLLKNSIRLFSIFIIIGLIQNFITQENLNNFLIRFKGIKGIIVGILTGGIMMGPVASGYPIAHFILKNGGEVSLVTAFLTSWVLIGIISISMEFKCLGKKFTILKNLFSILIIILISVLMEILI